MAGVDSAATRMRQRRLRQFLRHERLSVAMALAESQHHTSRGQKMARAGEEEYEEHDASRRQKPPPPQAFFRLYDEEDAERGVRPRVLAEPRPQERVLRHTVEYIVDFVCCAPMVQILDALVPQTVEQLPDVLQFFSTLTTDPEQVIEVPKILPEDVPMRAVLRDPQLAEVPTIVSYSWLQLRMEQTVDPPGGGLQDFRPGQSSFSSSHFPAGVPEALDEPGQGVFRTFPQNKQMRSRVRTRVRECPQVSARPRRHLSTVLVFFTGS